jgi:ABC-type branched-subunit amino acid transport system substrate-binding protein
MSGRGARITAASLVVGGAALFGLAALGQQGCAEEVPKPSAPEPIVIGVSLGLSRDLGSFTAPLRDALRAAEGEINAGGGLLGRPVRFDVVDDKSDEGDGVRSVVEGFANKGVVAVIGPVSSGQVKATQDILAGRQIIQLTPSATSVELTDIQPSTDRFLFRTTPADDFQGAAVILFATRTPRGLGDAGASVPEGGAPKPCTRLALVYIDNPYGKSMAKVIKDNFPRTGGEVVADKMIPLEAAASYETEANQIASMDPECLAIISYEKAAAQFIRDFKKTQKFKNDPNFFFIGTDGVYTQGFLNLSLEDPGDPTSPSAAEGVFGTNPDTQPGTTEYNAFKTIYASYFPIKPTDDAPAFAANTFDAAILVAFAIQKAGTTLDRIAIRDALKEVSRPGGRPITPAEISQGLLELREGGDIDYKGASGNVNLQDNGNVTAGFIVWQAVRDEATKRVVYKTVDRYTSESLMEQIR